ncbi:MAG: ABC transporter ATP-binding protein [Gemmatimonadetes bacterium]|nr:ABC transporter ATP-binding protein/permease [Gemmatimonadota bacterium]NNF13388.1 ABC transporter ATP-binding protein [Gemmatimonadota bacterium]
MSSFTPTARGVLRHYWGVVGGRWWHLAIPIALVLAAAAFEAVSYSLLIPLTDAVSQNSFDFLEDSRWFGWILALVPDTVEASDARDAYLVVVVVGLVIAGRIGKLVLEYVSKLFVVQRNERYRVEVGEETFARVLGFGRQYFDRNAVGRVDAEIGWSSSVLGLLTAAEGLFQNAIGLLVKGGVMVGISLPLSIAFILSLPFVHWFMNTINRTVERIAREGVEVDRRLRSRIVDILGSIPLVKAYSQERATAAAYADVLREAEDIAVRRGRVISLRYPVEEVVILLVMLVVQGAVIFWVGDFRPGDLAAFGAFLLILQQSLRDYKYVSEFSLKVSEEIPRLEAVAGLFVDEGKFIVPSGPRRFDQLEEAIEVQGLDFRYQDGVDTLRDISVTLEAGKVTAIVGPTGAGKTTFVDLIARFYDVDPDTIRLDGVDIRDYSLSSLHATMAIVSQDVWLLNGTLRQNLTFGLDRPADQDELMDALHDVELGRFVEGLRQGLDTEIGDRGVQLSGGQRQRVALARALLRDPDILILDEATSALDSVIEQRVAKAILARAEGRTLIVIAHRLSTIRDADKILVLVDGRIVEEGTWDELVALGGRFAELHGAQFGEGAARKGAP